MPKRIDTDALFDTTLHVFAERGYAEATTQEIATRAGVNEVTIFRKYGTKAGLIETAITQRLAGSPFAHIAASDDIVADLGAIVRAYDATNRAYGGAVMTLLVELPRHPELASAASILLTNLTNAAAIMRVHQEQGRIQPGDPLQKVALLVAPLIAGGLWSRAMGGIPATDFDPDALVVAFLDGHAAR